MRYVSFAGRSNDRSCAARGAVSGCAASAACNARAVRAALPRTALSRMPFDPSDREKPSRE
eukprot:365946-Chlamydomonas_euryale.AAC.6